MITWMKKVASSFQIEKFSLSVCLIFRQLQLGVAYESVAYKKNRVSFSYYFHDFKYMYFSEHI